MLKKPSGQTNKKRVLGRIKNDMKYLEKVVLGDGSNIFDEEDKLNSVNEETLVTENRAPAWIDETDDIAEGSYVLKDAGIGSKVDKSYREKQFHKVVKKPKWSDYSESVEPHNDILKRCGNLIIKSHSLDSSFIQIKKLQDLNHQTYNEGSLNVIKFHPKSTVAMVAGMSGVVSLFQVDGRENTKLQSIKYHEFPIDSAAFLKNGEELIAGSRYHNYFHSFNLMTGDSHKINNAKIDEMENIKMFIVSPNDKFIAVCGKYCKIFILSCMTKECIFSFQMNCKVKAMAFNHNGSKLYSFGDDGDVYIWDMVSRQCVKKFTDDGCLSGTAIDVSSNDRFLACGSNTGVVNIYDVRDIMADKFTPLKIFYNLVTPITNVTFNPTSEILSMSSSYKENAVRLANLSNMTVFSNFPNLQDRLKIINCVDFSPNSGYYALGSCQRIANLFRLKYFGNY